MVRLQHSFDIELGTILKVEFRGQGYAECPCPEGVGEPHDGQDIALEVAELRREWVVQSGTTDRAPVKREGKDATPRDGRKDRPDVLVEWSYPTGPIEETNSGAKYCGRNYLSKERITK